jgi:hypothetical protein
LNELTDLFPSLIDYLANGLSLYHLKFAFILLLARVNESQINQQTTLSIVNNKIFLDGMTVWTDVVFLIASAKCNPEGEDAFRYLTNQPPPVIKMQQCTTDVVKQQIEQILIANQIQRHQTMYHKWASGEATPNLEKSLKKLRPAIENDPALVNSQSDTLFIIQPTVAETQFRTEHRYIMADFVNSLSLALDSCALERKSHDGSLPMTFKAENFEQACQKLSTALTVFANGSMSDLNVTWKEYLTTTCAEIERNKDSTRLVQRIGSFVHAGFQRRIETEKISKCQDELLELTALRSEHHRRMRARAPIEHEIEDQIRNEFDKLLADLRNQITTRQSMFSDIRRSVMDRVAKKIETAKAVSLTVDRSGDYDAERSSAATNMALFTDAQTESAKLTKQVTKTRIMKSMSEVAAFRFFKKRIMAVELDRKVAHSLLWSSRLASEISEQAVQAERLKSQLENEKATNSQLVHWKAKNLKTVDILKQQLSAFKGVGDVNIDTLLEKLCDRHAELDVLREEGNGFDQQVKEEVEDRMTEVDPLRAEITSTRCQKAELLTSMREKETDEEPPVLDIGSLRKENVKLKRANELLEEEIRDLENQKDRRACDVRRFMETTVAPPPASLRSSAKAPGIIIRPVLAPKAIGKL